MFLFEYHLVLVQAQFNPFVPMYLHLIVLLLWVEVINAGDSKSLLGVEIMWVQDPGFPPHSFLRLLTNTLHKKLYSHFTSLVAQKLIIADIKE